MAIDQLCKINVGFGEIGMQMFRNQCEKKFLFRFTRLILEWLN